MIVRVTNQLCWKVAMEGTRYTLRRVPSESAQHEQYTPPGDVDLLTKRKHTSLLPKWLFGKGFMGGVVN